MKVKKVLKLRKEVKEILITINLIFNIIMLYNIASMVTSANIKAIIWLVIIPIVTLLHGLVEDSIR